MNRATFSLNYRKPKSEYSGEDELFICIRKYEASSKKNKPIVKQISSGIKCKISDWDVDWHKKPERYPVKKTDPNYLKKNKALKNKALKFLKNQQKTNKKTKYSSTLNPKIPSGELKNKWINHKNSIKLVNPANKRNIDIIVVGTGLAGGSAAATLAELGYNVKTFCYQDSPRRAHSIAAQGGINAAKNYQNDGDSVYRLFYDTVKGGDYRSREANVYRLAEFHLSRVAF